MCRANDDTSKKSAQKLGSERTQRNRENLGRLAHEDADDKGRS